MTNVSVFLLCKGCRNAFAPRSNRQRLCDSCTRRTCEWCKETYHRAPKPTDPNPRFCSPACANAHQCSPAGIEEHRQIGIRLRGTGRVIECETCGTKVYRQGARLAFNHLYCSWACRNHRADAAASTKERVLHFPTRTEATRLEIAGRALLNQIGVRFVEQQIIGGKFVVDVLIPDAAIIIQWDGDFWHGNPAIYPDLVYKIQQSNVKRDRACNAYLAKCGYTVLRFWECDVHSRPSWVVSEVAAALANSAKT